MAMAVVLSFSLSLPPSFPRSIHQSFWPQSNLPHVLLCLLSIGQSSTMTLSLLIIAAVSEASNVCRADKKTFSFGPLPGTCNPLFSLVQQVDES